MLIFLAMIAMELKPGAGAPEFRQPQLAASGTQVALTYGAGLTIYFASSKDGGRTFAPAVKVADTTGLMLGRHRGPRVSILPHSLVISAVGAKGNLGVWHSVDSGVTWTRAGTINDTPGAAREGLHAMVADRAGNLFAAWLDVRQSGPDLFGAKSTDGGVTWSKNVAIYRSPEGSICQCCDPSLAPDEKGGVAVMWRNLLSGNRDMYLSRSSDGVQFGAAQKLGTASWALNACPMDGGGLVTDHGRLVSVWRRGRRIFMNEPGKPETPLGAGKDVSVTATTKGVYAVWTGDKGVEARVPGKNAAAQLSDDGAFPNVTALPDGSALAAWEEKGAIRLERLH